MYVTLKTNKQIGPNTLEQTLELYEDFTELQTSLSQLIVYM